MALSSYKRRHADQILAKYLANFPVILVEGPKAVGKTRTCENFAKTSYYLDLAAQLEVLAVNPSLILTDPSPVLIDEWQKLPEIWNFSRRVVDHGLEEGSIMLTGSSPKLHADLHSGAGRIVHLKMRPYTIEERELTDLKKMIRISDFLSGKIDQKISGKTNLKLSDYLDEIFRSGFPGIHDKNEYARAGLLESYVDNLINKEFAENGFQVKKPESLHSWLKAYAVAIASTATFSKILDASCQNSMETPNRRTADNYRDILLSLNIIEELPSWLGFGKLFKALTKSPKHYLIDVALLTPLLGITKEKLLKDEVPRPIGKINKTFIGQILESFVYQSLVTYSEVNNLRISHLRAQNGRKEIDFILETRSGDLVLAIEVKTASSINNQDVQHLNWFEETVGAEFKVIKIILYLGEFAYTRADHVQVIPVGMLGA